MKYKIIKLFKEDSAGKSVLVFELKDAEGNKRTIRSSTLQPRFYVPRTQMIYDDERIVGTEQVKQTHILTKEPMTRVYTSLTGDVGSLRKTTYRVPGKSSIACQADILFPEVAMVELNLYTGVEIDDSLSNMDSIPHTELKPCEPPDIEPTVCKVDIECQHYHNMMPDAKRDADIIYLIGIMQEGELKMFWVDNGYPIPSDIEVHDFCVEHGYPVPAFYSEINVIVCKDEQELLTHFLEHFESLDPDILTGWNVQFDVDYIMARSKKYRLGTRWWHLIRKTNVHCLMESYKRLYRAPSNHFKDVVIHEEVTDVVIEESHNVDWWKDGENLKALVYNAFDVIWLQDLDLKKEIIVHDWGVKELAGFPDLEPTNWRMPIVDILSLRVAKDDYILPSRIEREDAMELRTKKKGAIVFQPETGAKYGVAILDFSMYYPYIIIAHNLSKEIPEGQLSPKGIMPRVCEVLIKHRLAAKAAEKQALAEFGPESIQKKKAKRMNDVSKFMLNSVFGVTGNPRFRLYEKRVFEAITGFGREGLQLIKQMSEDKGFSVIYGDTDSLFIQFASYEQAKNFSTEINERLNGMFKDKYGITVDFDIKVEKWLSPVVFSKTRKGDRAGKKRYFYRVVIEDDINLEEKGQDYVVIMGHANVRRDASPLCKHVQKKVFEDIAYGRVDNIVPFLRDCWNKYMNGEFSLEAISARMTIQKSFDDYKSPTVAVRGAMYLNEKMNPSTKVAAGDTVRYVYVKSVDGKRDTDVVSFINESDVEGRIEVDLETMFQKQIIAKTEDVLDDVDIYWEQIMGQTDLTAFF